MFHLDPLPPAPIGGLSAGYVLAGALSVALTSLILVGIGRPHPPAGASTLIVSLGILTTPVQLGTMALAVLFLTVAGWGLNAALGLRGAQLGQATRACVKGSLLGGVTDVQDPLSRSQDRLHERCTYGHREQLAWRKPSARQVTEDGLFVTVERGEGRTESEGRPR